jgi:hypothetical protein
MKVDKDTLVKQRFWVGLGAFSLFWLIVLLIALFTLSDKATGSAGKLKQQKDQINNAKDIKNESFTKLVTEKKEELQGKKNEVWAQAWLPQQGIMFWPKENTGPWRHLEQAGYFSETIAPNDLTTYRSLYDAQMPVDGDNGIKRALWPVQARGGKDQTAAWNQLIRRVSWDPHLTPTNEEAWLAQEDLWVQWELLSVVKSALDYAAAFENVAFFKRVDAPKEPEKPAAEASGTAAAPAADEAKKPTLLRQRFRNPHWQLDLVLEPAEGGLIATTQTTLKRLGGDAAQPVAGIDLQVGQWAQKQPPAQHLVFEGKPDGKGQVALAKEVKMPGFAPNIDDFPFSIMLVADKADPPPAKEGAKRHRLRNANWELELILERAPDGQYVVSDKSKVTNISASQRTLEIGSAVFAVRQAGRYLTNVTVPDELLAPGASAATNKSATPFVLPEANMPVEVYQVFSWDTSPIKRVDAIELPGGNSFNSHRTANLMLKPAAQFPIPEAPKEDKPAGGGPMGMSGSGGGPMGMSGSGLSGGGNAGQDTTSKTPNGLIRNRYISVTEQVRHMPVALELVCDQAHMQDVLTAVVNSRLRIQVTQVQWKRIRGVKPSGDDSFAGGMGPGMPGGMGPGMSGPAGGMDPNRYGRSGGASPPSGYNPGGGYGPGFPGGMGSGRGPAGSGSGMMGPPGGMGSRGGMGPGGAGSSGSGPASPPGVGGSGSVGGGRGSSPSRGAASGDDSDPNLVQLAVYGIASLYERYPPKPKTDAAAAPGGPAATTPAPGTPAQPTK